MNTKISDSVKIRFIWFVAVSLMAILHRVGRNPNYDLERKSQEMFICIQNDIDELT